MTALTPADACKKYPAAWERLVEDMDVARHGYATSLLPVAVEIITVDGEQVLEVAALTDIPVGDDDADDGGSMTMTFRASIAHE